MTPDSIFRKGTEGWVMDMNRLEYLAIVQKLRAIRVPDGCRTIVGNIMPDFNIVLHAFEQEVKRQADLHPEDLK